MVRGDDVFSYDFEDEDLKEAMEEKKKEELKEALDAEKQLVNC